MKVVHLLEKHDSAVRRSSLYSSSDVSPIGQPLYRTTCLNFLSCWHFISALVPGLHGLFGPGNGPWPDSFSLQWLSRYSSFESEAGEVKVVPLLLINSISSEGNNYFIKNMKHAITWMNLVKHYSKWKNWSERNQIQKASYYMVLFILNVLEKANL